jgi:hypothetical protein
MHLFIGRSRASSVERDGIVGCIVQDLSEIVATASVPEGLEGRLSFQAHDFSTEQPVKDDDVYYFKWIFHDCRTSIASPSSRLWSLR